MPPDCRLDAAFQARLIERLRAFEVRGLAAEGRRRAAVAMVLMPEGLGSGIEGVPCSAPAPSDAAALLLTRRSAGLRAHAGQWALPGGRVDAGETPEQAALRELREEVGLVVAPDAVLGRLDDYATRSGYVITPVLVWSPDACDLVANPDEVASVHRLPVAELLRADAPLLDQVPGGVHPVLRMPVGRSWIAAPTAAFLYQFRELCLLGRPARVAHFDQPAFAWR
ncbi:MAG: CoA pyrophosphatase [Rubrivivax sp.]|nr:CoA pyrophosphatase [Rubrivivax sp.]